MANTASEEPLHPLTPEQVRVGTNKIMTHAERQAFWKNSDVGKQLGFDKWQQQPMSKTNFIVDLT